MLLCPTISDHDGPYALLNVRLKKYEPRFKYIRDERQFNEAKFIKDLKQVPFNLVYGVEDPDDKLEKFNSLLLEAINHHAPVKKIKVTRPPAPWMHDPEIRYLQQTCFQNRVEFRNSRDQNVLKTLRENRSLLKKKIRAVKSAFYRTALSPKKPKELWKIINAVLHPPSERTTLNLDEMNFHFASTAERTLNKTATPVLFYFKIFIQVISFILNMFFKLTCLTKK